MPEPTDASGKSEWESGPDSWETFGHFVDELIERAYEIEGVRVPAGLVGSHEVWLHPTAKVQDWLRDFANEYRLWHLRTSHSPDSGAVQ